MKIRSYRKVAIITVILIVCISPFFLVIENSNDTNDNLANNTISTLIDSSITNYYKPLFENKQKVEIFISPTGNDSFIGNKEYPLATAEKAISVLQSIKIFNRQRNKTYSVTFLEGTYFLKKTLVLNSLDSGKPDFPVTIKGEEEKKIVISGGFNIDPKFIEKASEKLPGWSRLDSVAREKIKMIDLKKQGIKNYGYISRSGFGLIPSAAPLELFINDKAMNLARWPNNSYAGIDSVKDSTQFQSNTTRFKRWDKENDIWAKGFWKYGWADFSLPIKFIDTKKNIVHLGIAPPHDYGLEKDRQWFGYNLLPELDTAGEYYIDRQSGWMYFIPPDDIPQNKMNISVSVFDNNNSPLLKIDSSENIIIKNITFKDTRSAGIKVERSDHIKIENCTVQNTGTYAIDLEGENCTLNGLKIFNTGAYGINITGGDRKTLTKANNVIENCVIHSLGRINYTISCYGISLNGVGNIARNCEIYDSPHTAIFFTGNYQVIEKNKIHDVCIETDDAGAIYCGRDWALRGNMIKYNFIYNFQGSGYIKRHKGIHAIYLDDCASGITVFGNIFYNIGCAGVLNGGGRDNIIENNVFVNCRWAHRADRRGGLLKEDGVEMYKQLERLNYTDPPWSIAFPELAKMSKMKTDLFEFLKLEYIILKFPELSSALGIKYFSDLNPDGCTFSRNIIWKNREKEFLSDTRTSKAQRHGPFKFYTIENNLENKDPLFVDEENLNFDLLDNSPAYKVPGFERIPFEEIGLLNKKSNFN